MTRNGGVKAEESEDGKTLYFSKDGGKGIDLEDARRRRR